MSYRHWNREEMYTGDLLERMYPDEDPVQNVQRRDHLVDLYLNMPDKVGKCIVYPVYCACLLRILACR
jgi:hypothetical protein